LCELYLYGCCVRRGTLCGLLCGIVRVLLYGFEWEGEQDVMQVADCSVGVRVRGYLWVVGTNPDTVLLVCVGGGRARHTGLSCGREEGQCWCRHHCRCWWLLRTCRGWVLVAGVEGGHAGCGVLRCGLVQGWSGGEGSVGGNRCRERCGSGEERRWVAGVKMLALWGAAVVTWLQPWSV
jgi:hypothetical protein